MNIESQDVIRLILQFLKENNLDDSFNQLQSESQVLFNSVPGSSIFKKSPDKKEFHRLIVNGNWDIILRQINQLSIHPKKLVDLYDQIGNIEFLCVIVLELIEMKEIDAARSIFRDTDPMIWLRDHSPDRYIYLEQLINKDFNEKEAYAGGPSKKTRRENLALALTSHLQSAQPNRLLNIINDAIKWRSSLGLIPLSGSYDLFNDVVPESTSNEDAVPSCLVSTIQFEKKQKPTAICFSSVYFCTGSDDGFIEVWDTRTGKLDISLPYQSNLKLMKLEDSVLCLKFANDQKTLVGGSKSGSIKIFNVETGQLLRKFPVAHTQSITSCSFNESSSSILSSSFDQTVTIHGIKSGKLLKEFRGHSSIVNDVVYSTDQTKIISVGSDCCVKVKEYLFLNEVWDVKTTDCLNNYWLMDGKVYSSLQHTSTINQVLSYDNSMIICDRSHIVYIITLDGKLVRKFKNKNKKEFTAISISQKHEYLYTLCEDKTLYCWDIATGVFQGELKVSENEVIHICRHPKMNLFATCDQKSEISIWSD